MPTSGKAGGDHGAAAAREGEPERADGLGGELANVHGVLLRSAGVDVPEARRALGAGVVPALSGTRRS